MALAETALAYGFRNRLDPVAGFENVKSDAFQSTLGVIPANQASLDARAASEALSQQAMLVNNAAARAQRKQELEQSNKWNREDQSVERRNALLRSLSYLGRGQGQEASLPQAPTPEDLWRRQAAWMEFDTARRRYLADGSRMSRGAAEAATVQAMQNG